MLKNKRISSGKRKRSYNNVKIRKKKKIKQISGENQII